MTDQGLIMGHGTDEQGADRNISGNAIEERIAAICSLYYGMSQDALIEHFVIKNKFGKSKPDILLNILNDEDTGEAREYLKNNHIAAKTVRVEQSGKIRESLPFNAFKFTDLVEETWETSTLYRHLTTTRYLFQVYKRNAEGKLIFTKVFFWSMPETDLRAVAEVWRRTKHIIETGVKTYFENGTMHNNLPKKTESHIAHVRPHARDCNDTYPLPDGRSLPKQSFWLNNDYISNIVDQELHK